MAEETVLVTRGTGFIAQYCMIALLKAGYTLRTTARPKCANISRLVASMPAIA